VTRLGGDGREDLRGRDTTSDECGDTAGASSVFTKPKNFVWADWIPGCATFHTKILKNFAKIEIRRLVL